MHVDFFSSIYFCTLTFPTMQGQDHDLFNQPYFSSNQNPGGGGGHPSDRSNAPPPPFSYHHSQPQHASQTASTSSNRYDPFQGLSTAAQIDLVLQQASEQQQQEDEAGVVTPENEIHSNSAPAPSTSTSSGRKKVSLFSKLSCIRTCG